MSDSSVEAQSTQALAVRLRLKRKFLIALIVSLAASAAIATGVFLFGKFDETAFRILGSLAALAVHSLIAMVLAISVEKRRGLVLHSTGLALFAVNFFLQLACIWWPVLTGSTYRSVPPPVRGTLTTLVLIGYYILTLPGAALWEKRRWQPLPQTTVLACIVGLGMVLVCIWSDWNRSYEVFSKATAIAAIVAFSLAHTSLLGRLPVSTARHWLLGATILCIWGVAATFSFMIVADSSDEFIIRVLGTLGVLDFAGTLVLLILVKLRQVTGVEQLESVTARVEIRCPRCSEAQTVDAGASKCRACGLKFRIEIEEPRCAKCGYLLWQLPERRCPECGLAF
ncbi:MAG TPA: hypothetical protein PKY77_24780 [Phycisphaerae bacterium]|nr:hypothetical protein [Phycisphaerae bacterium]HRY71403.1 hypothetical protein [Phycisphaerae bacterium]HSA29898.1 hypothetical protein [Phycisphaerae bacterium]